MEIGISKFAFQHNFTVVVLHESFSHVCDIRFVLGVLLFVQLCLMLAIFFVRRYQKKTYSERPVTIVSTLALFFVLLTMALVPVDVFIVTSMKDADGNYKVWKHALSVFTFAFPLGL